MKFWKEHAILRVVLIALLFAVGMALTIRGWMKTGQLGGIFEMLLGVGGLLSALALYNRPYRD